MGIQSDYFKIGQTAYPQLAGTGYNGGVPDLAFNTAYTLVICTNDPSNPPTAAGLILPATAANWAVVSNNCTSAISVKLSAIDPNAVTVAAGETAYVVTDSSRYYKTSLGTVTLDIGSYAATTAEAGTSYLLIKNIDGTHYKILLSELMNFIASQLTASSNPLLVADYVYTSNITQSGAVANQDGLTPAAGSTVLCTGQSVATNNGLWVTAAGAWTRATSMAAASHAAGKVVAVKYSSSNGSGTLWFCASDRASDTVGTNALTFWDFGVNLGIGDVRDGSFGPTGVRSVPVVVSTSGDGSGVLIEKQVVTNKTPVTFGSRIVALNNSGYLKEEIVPNVSGGTQLIDWTHHVQGARASKTARFSVAYSATGGTGLTAQISMVQLDTFWNLLSGDIRFRARSQTSGAVWVARLFVDGVFAASARHNCTQYALTGSTTWSTSSTQPNWGAGAGEAAIVVTPQYASSTCSLTATWGTIGGTATFDIEWDCDLSLVNAAVVV